MKTSFMVMLVVGAAAVSLAGCETANSQAAAPAGTSNVYVGGQGVRDVQVPADNGAEANQTPYAVRGNEQSGAAAEHAPRFGYNGVY